MLQQNIADMFKGVVLSAKIQPAFRRVMLAEVADFERLMWNQAAFDDALTAQANGLIAIDQEQEHVPYRVDNENSDVIEAIYKVLRDYRERIESLDRTLLTTEQAAAYLGVGIEQFNAYAIRQKRIAPFKRVGFTRMYATAELDRFLTERRAPGRRKQADADNS